jgi:hypothetical protein
MKVARYILFFCLMLVSAGAISSTDRQVGDFALLDQHGAFHQLSRYSLSKAVVIYSYATQSDGAAPALEKLEILRDRYRDRGVHFLLIDPAAEDRRSAVSEVLGSEPGDFSVLLDSAQLVSKSLGIRSYGEVLVIDPAKMTLIYRGAIDSRAGETGSAANALDSRNYLDEVLSVISLGGEPIGDTPWDHGEQVRYLVDTSEAYSEVSYARQVVPVLERRCVACHRDGGVAPWAMDSHQMVQGWAPMIRETLMTRRMPPGQIDDYFLDRFDDVHFITDEEKAILVSWIDQGAAFDGDLDPLTSLPAQESEWALGEPDLIVEFPPQEIPASGVLGYKFVPVEIGLDRDRWVRAYEFDIGDKSVLHHVVAYTQDARQQRQNQSGGGSRTNFGGYAPGREYVTFDEDTGILLEEDMRFVVQFHYTTVGKPVTDVTRLGLYFHDSPPALPLTRTAVMDGEFVIPPGAPDHMVVARSEIVSDSYLYNIAPHMHYRGKRVKYRAEYPDGTSEELLSIPNFQHNWQMIYKLREPKLLPAGTVIVAEGAFDNSALNPLNPDPTQEVRWGDQVWDEMFIAWMRLSEAP